MNIILLGAPGAGKGTQAVKIAEKYKIPHISTGDIFRKNIKEQTEIGKIAKSYIDKGQLVPDSVVIDLVNSRLIEPDCKNGYLLDGFPRTIAQAESLSKITKIETVLNLDIDLDFLMKRLTGRRVCSKCGESFHIDFLNGKKICNKCESDLYQRDDDTEMTVNSRLSVYTNQTAPLIDYYKNLNVLKNIVGTGSVEEVFERILKILG